jgi:streptogramin lyase
MPHPLQRALTLLAVAVLAVATWSPASAASRPDWDTRVFAMVPSPGFPAYVHVHTNGRVYAGSYVDSDSLAPSKVFEWSPSGKLLRSWVVPGQVLDEDHGVQVANQTRDGRLVLLETSTASILTLDVGTGRFQRVVRLPHGAVPNYATWGPGGALFVTDYAEGVIWKVPHGSRTPTRWFSSPALSSVEFGTTGVRFRPGTRDLLITQQTSTDGASLPTNGHLYRLPVRADGRPGVLQTLWTSRPGDLPDGFGIGRSGHVYVALAGLANQLVELTASGTEVTRFPQTPLTGDNGSPVPFDTPCSATFLGTRVLVANQSAVTGDASHQAILDVQVGEAGQAPYLPRTATFQPTTAG